MDPQPSIVHRIIARSNRNLFLWCMLGIVILGGVAALSYRYLANLFLGPQPLNSQQITAIKDSDSQFRYYVTVTGDDVTDTGFQQVSESGSSQTVEASYFALLVNRQILLIKGKGEASSTVYTGALVSVPADVSSNVIAGLVSDQPNLNGRFLPFMLDTSDFRTSGFIGLGIGILVFALCIWGLIRVVLRTSDPPAHPIMRALKRFGPLDETVSHIDGDLNADHSTIGRAHLTANWLLYMTSSSLAAERLNDVVWMYKQVTQHRTNGIPTGKSYTALIWDRYGYRISVPGKQDVIDKTLEEIYRHVPWVLVGYGADLEKAWRTNRANVIAAVDQRRSKQ